MDHDDKVKDLIIKGKKEFLKGSGIKEAKQEAYQLDREFAKTKKNRSPIVWISVVLFIVIFGAAATLVTLYIERESKQVTVDIEDFADVNLRDVLDRAKKIENELEAAKRELQNLLAARDNEIKAVRDELQRQLNLLENRSISAGEKQRQEADLENQAAADIETINADYQPRIEALEARIAALQDELDAYDTRLVEQAKEQQEILNSQQRKHEIEMASTVDYYESQINDMTIKNESEVSALNEYHDSFVQQQETNHANEIRRLKQLHAREIAALILKYNPEFSSPRLLEIINRSADLSAVEAVEIKRYRSVLGEEDLLSVSEFRQLRSYLEDLSLLTARLQEVPYENSIDPAVNQIENLAAIVLEHYEELWSGLADKLAERNMDVAHFIHALDSLVADSRENGYVLDPRDSEKIIVFIDKIHQVSEGDLGYVFREEDELIGIIRFSVTPREITASLVEITAPEETIAPFDKILIQIHGES